MKEGKGTEENKEHTIDGKLSIVFGITGIITIYNWLGFLLWSFIPFCFGLLAIITGLNAKRHDDTYWKIGIMFSSIPFSFGLIGFIVILIYICVSSLIG